MNYDSLPIYESLVNNTLMVVRGVSWTQSEQQLRDHVAIHGGFYQYERIEDSFDGYPQYDVWGWTAQSASPEIDWRIKVICDA